MLVEVLKVVDAWLDLTSWIQPYQPLEDSNLDCTRSRSSALHVASHMCLQGSETTHHVLSPHAIVTLSLSLSVSHASPHCWRVHELCFINHCNADGELGQYHISLYWHTQLDILIHLGRSAVRKLKECFRRDLFSEKRSAEWNSLSLPH